MDYDINGMQRQTWIQSSLNLIATPTITIHHCHCIHLMSALPLPFPHIYLILFSILSIFSSLVFTFTFFFFFLLSLIVRMNGSIFRTICIRVMWGDPSPLNIHSHSRHCHYHHMGRAVLSYTPFSFHFISHQYSSSPHIILSA